MQDSQATRTRPRPAPPAALAPLATSDWTPEAAAHLLRRAGFGGRPEEVRELAELAPGEALARVVDFPAEEPELEAAIVAAGSDLDVGAGASMVDDGMTSARLPSWWIFRMAHTRAPLREKLTLFWHDHFPSSGAKVLRAPLLHAQNQIFRTLGPGPFRALVGAVARDPAMLVYLDGRVNQRGQPNENWARELMELFTLGVDRYTQADVSELARVFTGWTTPVASGGDFQFDPEMHDPGDKQLFGTTIAGRGGPEGIAEGEQALDLIVARPECARFLAGKLLAFFAGPSWPEEVELALAEVLAESELNTREALRALFGSAWFHAPERRFAHHRSGVEVAIGAVRCLGVQNAHLMGLDDLLRRLGMQLFEPPSVAGWPSGRAWVQTGAMIERWRLAGALAALPHTRLDVIGRPAFDLDALVASEQGAGEPSDEQLVDAACSRVLARQLVPEQRAALVDLAAGSGERAGSTKPRDVRRAKLRALVHVLVASPEFAMA